MGGGPDNGAVSAGTDEPIEAPAVTRERPETFSAEAFHGRRAVPTNAAANSSGGSSGERGTAPPPGIGGAAGT